MILDRIDSAERYFSIHASLRAAFEYLRRTDIAKLADGKYEIDGKRVYLLMSHASGRGRDGARLEAHRRYIDMQIPISAAEEMGWRPRALCQHVSQKHDEKTDIEFFADEPQTYLTVQPGCFVLFFPDDAHAPLACTGEVHKAVVKIAVD